MANSGKLKSSELRAAVAAVLRRHVSAHARLCLGFSGGIDSRVLLDVLAGLAGEFPFELSCVHVHHGISPNADEWARFARRTARAYGLAFKLKKVDIAPHRHLGLEAAARTARYAAYASIDADFLLSAQHGDDQAETVLLQLVRGAGADGLAAMPEKREFAPDRFLLRPLLDATRAQIEAYAQKHALEWVEDESNADRALGRNFLRHEVMPRLRKLNPAAEANIARSARHLGEAASLLDEFAALDLARYAQDRKLDLHALAELSPARMRNLLRAWLRRAGAGAPNAEELAEMLRQLHSAKADAQIECRVGGQRLRRYQDEAWLIDTEAAPANDFLAVWNGAREWHLPELSGVLRFESTRGKGIAADWLAVPSAIQVRVRQGGEHFRPDAARPRRSLKKLFQEQGIAPWVRDRLPLLYSGDRLVFVPGVGVAAEAQADARQAAMTVEWQPLSERPR
jgi:tRNA(Ile)-lysidine synthase